MKKRFSLIASLYLIFTLVFTSCASLSGEDTSNSALTITESATPVVDTSITAEEATGDFSLTTEDGAFTQSGNIYTISAAGIYTLSGNLTGQILISAGEEDEVELDLEGVTIKYGKDSPVKAVSASKVEISAKSDTENVITDNRSEKTADSEEQGEGAISAKCDLKLKGSGTLVVTGNYNNGVHTTKDLTIQKLSLKAIAVNNALKGKDSITVKSGAVVAISTAGDGVQTDNTDLNKSGEVRGDILISGGAVTVYAAGDAFQAAHNFTLTTGEEGVSPTVTVYTGSYSGYTSSSASTTSYKGVKVQNELLIASGSIALYTYDDGLHADAGTSFTAGGTGAGVIRVTGGTVTAAVYAPEGKTGGGRSGPRGGWGGQQSVSGADAIHADSTLVISGGAVLIDSSYEGLEANVIRVEGGHTTITASDDGVNACKGSATPSVQVTGGLLDVTVSPNGDTDGIDSNGTYTQTGGVVITRGPSSQMAAAIDADSSVTVSGGTLIVLGYGSVRTGGSVSASSSLSLHASGSHTVTIDGTAYTFTNASSYGRTTVYSDVSVSA